MGYAISAVYFAGVMVRLMLVLTPCVCILSAIAFSRLFELYLKEEETGGADEKKVGGAANGVNDKVDGSDKNGRLYDKAGKMRKIRHEQKEADGEGLGVNIRSIVIVTVLMILMMFAVHCTWVTSNAYS